MDKSDQTKTIHLALSCIIKDVHPAANKEHKFLKLKLSANLQWDHFALFYPEHNRLKPFFEIGCPAQSAKLWGSSRVFQLTIKSENAEVLLESSAALASCDIGTVDNARLPCDFLFVINLDENSEELLTLAKLLKETVPVIFDVRQGELALAEQTSLAEKVMDKEPPC